MSTNGQERRVRARAAEVELPRARRIDVARLAPSGRSLLIAFALVVLGIGAYFAARESPLFAIDSVEVVGGTPAVRVAVRGALAPLEGRSLVDLERDDVERPLAALPDVAGATYDRAFPDTLRVFVHAERPLAVVRRGAESWLVSARGRLLRQLPKGARAGLPRVWVGRGVELAAGDVLADATAARSVRILAAARAELPARVRGVRADGDDTALMLRNGIEVRLGREQDVRLKLAVAGRVLPFLAQDVAYLDVAVPARPVAGTMTEPQVQVEGAQP